LSRSLAARGPRSPITLASRRLGTKGHWSPGNLIPMDPRSMIPSPIGFPLPCSIGIQVPVHPCPMLPRSLHQVDNMAPGDLGTMLHRATRLLDPWPPRDPGPSPDGSPGTKPNEPPGCHDPSMAQATWFQGSSQQRGSSVSTDLGAHGPGDQAIKFALMPRHRGRQAAAGSSVPSSHRPPWSLSLMGPSST